jgi:hypothetical protein
MGDEMSDRIAALEAKVDRFERIIRAFVENPFIYDAATFRPLLDEMGYDYTPPTYTDRHGTISNTPTVAGLRGPDRFCSCRR